MAKPKTKGATSASKPGQTATKPKSKASAKARPPAAAERAAGKPASRLIDERIKSLADWRGETLAEVRRIIREADPDIVEEWKWMGTPVWSHAGNICTGETYREVVKLTFARGASLKDPRQLFNSSLEGNTRRAIDIREGEAIDAKALRALIQAAVAENVRASAPPSKSPREAAPKTKAARAKAAPAATRGAKKAAPVLLAGGNPQVAKADGDAPVQAYIAAIPPGWKQDLARRLDALVVRCVPNVRKAVKWNSPFYGIEGQGWFFSFHVFTRFLKATFFRGTSLKPAPAGGAAQEARWIDVHEHDLDEAQLATWIKQAAAIPGWTP